MSFDGDAIIQETAARDIASLYTFTGADGTVTADLTGGSQVAGDFTFNNNGGHPTDRPRHGRDAGQLFRQHRHRGGDRGPTP